MVVVTGVLGAVACGAGIAAQTRINGQLGAEIGDGYVAAVISFGSGLVVLLVLLAVSRAARRGLGIISGGLRTGSIPWWMVMGGSAGALFVLSQGLAAGVLGIAVFTVAVVFGQTVSGLVIDRRGLGSAAPRSITPARLVGSALMLAAVILIVLTQFTSDVPWWLVLLPLAAGFAMPWQQAANGQIRVISHSPIAATLLNFVVGTTLLGLACVVNALFAGLPQTYPSNPVLYLGGVIGVVFIAFGAILAPRIGVLLLALGTISGQLVVALLLDVVVPADGHPLALTTIIGTAITLVALAVAAVPLTAIRASRGSSRP